jgi:hypothetical protein
MNMLAVDIPDDSTAKWLLDSDFEMIGSCLPVLQVEVEGGVMP